MVKFRFFGSEPKPLVISHPQVTAKDPMSITPPLMVIRALYDSPQHTSADYLSFVKHDYLHVVSKTDSNFYLACNPALRTQGLVPVSYFEIIHKQESSSTQQADGPRFPSASHDSGYGETVHHPADKTGQSPAASMRMSQKTAASGKCFYGKLLYTFQSERPDELMATEGETVLIVAISNDQWVIAKPIHRLGGPGLVPFNHLQVIDMKSGQLIENPFQNLLDAGVPTVEQWKSMASNYKDRSIQLGTIDTTAIQAPPQEVLQRTSANMSHAGPVGHTPTNSVTGVQYVSGASVPPPSQQKERSLSIKYRMEGREGDIFLIRASSKATFGDFYDKITASRTAHMTDDCSCRTPNFAITYSDPFTRAEVVISNQWNLARYIELQERPVLFLRGV